MASFEHILAHIEERLGSYYGFDVSVSAGSHLVSRDEIRESFGEEVTKTEQWSSRASVWLSPSEEETFLGLFIDDEVKNQIESDNPLTEVSSKNLDAFAVLIEEISHFHLLVNRIQSAKKVKHLELEYQGELDKLLVPALLLEEQMGDPHLLPLARTLFDQSRITSENIELYATATRFAARFWFSVASNRSRLDTDVRSFLKDHYHLNFDEKQNHLNSHSWKMAS